MENYYPDKWILLKVKDGDVFHYKIFGSWYGGYTGSDSWRINSGVKGVDVNEGQYAFYGNSGSIYNCRKSSYGVHSYGQSVLNKIKEVHGDNVQILEEHDISEFIKGFFNGD